MNVHVLLKPATYKGANVHLIQTVFCCLVVMQHQTTFTASNRYVRWEYMLVIKHF